MRVTIDLTVNGERYQAEVSPQMTLVEFLRGTTSPDRHEGRMRHGRLWNLHRSGWRGPLSIPV